MIKKIISKFLTGVLLVTACTAPFATVHAKAPTKKYIVKDMGKMDLEELVYYGLIAEMGYPSFNIEAYKAQAVAIRTFILNQHKHDNDPYDFCGTTHCFAIADTKKIQGFTSQQLDRFKKAVEDTKGQVITYKGKMISTPVFFAYGAHKTNTPNDVWGSDNSRYPYLKSVDTPEYKPPQELLFKKSEFLDKLGIKSMGDFVIMDKNYNGYNKKIKVGNNYYNGDKLRSKLGLKSGIFTLYDYGHNVMLRSYGYGHGVGMSQFGADVYAKRGKDYKWILKHYYTGVEIEVI